MDKTSLSFLGLPSQSIAVKHTTMHILCTETSHMYMHHTTEMHYIYYTEISHIYMHHTTHHTNETSHI